MRAACVLFALSVTCVTAIADDWPQWRGPQRDNVWRETGVIDKFPAGGPEILWRSPVAGGYAGPAVADGRVYVTDYVSSDDVKVDNFDRQKFTGTERVLCLDATTGKQLWKHEYPVTYGISYPAGPRCTPTVDEGLVYTLGAEGHLFCLQADSGQIVWSKDFPAQYSTTTALWGYASHPLIDGDKLICVVGGAGSHVVAFDKRTGNELWRALTATDQGYSPPMILEAAGARQLILLYPGGLTSLDPETGKQYWTVDYEATNGSVIMTPVVSGNLLYAGGFNNRNLLVELGQDKPSATVRWQNEVKAGIAPVNVQPFVENGLMYGFDQNGWLYGVEIETGERLWQSSQPLGTERPQQSATAFIVKQGDRFWLFNELGELLIAKLGRNGYEEIDRAKVIEPTNLAFGRRVVWSAPAWAGGKVFLRNDEECICVDLSK